jgi:hypothetical protein
MNDEEHEMVAQTSWANGTAKTNQTASFEFEDATSAEARPEDEVRGLWEPDQRDFDMAVIKTTPVTERINLIFRWETFNVRNRPNLPTLPTTFRRRAHSA